MFAEQLEFDIFSHNSYRNPTLSREFLEKAEGLEESITNAYDAALRNCRTAKQIAYGDKNHATYVQLKQLQEIYEKLSELHKSGECPQSLWKLRPNHVEYIFCTDEAEIVQAYQSKSSREFRSLIKIGLSERTAFKAKRILESYTDTDFETDELSLAKLQRQLACNKILGYVPTPTSLCWKMVGLAEISDGMRVLEPSAGSGHLLRVIREEVSQYSSASYYACEEHPLLREALKVQGFETICNDFFNLPELETFDRILMNPPFQNGAFITHIMRAFKHLRSGGRLVAVVPQSYYQSQNKRYKDFLAFLKMFNFTPVKVDAKAFLESDVPTSISTEIVVLDRP